MTIEVRGYMWDYDMQQFVWENAHTKPSSGYKLWYFHLRFSEYYYTAHKIVKGEPLSPREQLLAATHSFPRVQATYGAFSDVWCGLFESWWEKRGEFVFGIPGTKPKAELITHIAQGPINNMHSILSSIDQLLVTDRAHQNNPPSLLVSIPLTETRSQILSRIKSILDEFNIADPVGAKYVINNTSPRYQDLIKGLDVMWAYCNPNNRYLWQVGRESGLGAAFDPNSHSAQTSTIKRAVGQLAFNRIRDIRKIIENAAHGYFPSPLINIEHLGMRGDHELDHDYRSLFYGRINDTKNKEIEDALKRNIDLHRTASPAEF